MCLIIHKPKAELQIPDETIHSAVWGNKDGFGITFLDDGQTIHNVDSEAAYDYVYEDRPFILHLRYATKGTVTESNCHPFNVGVGKKTEDQVGTHWLFSNGTVDGLGSRTLCDTEQTANILAQVPVKYWPHVLAMTPTRFATVHKKTLHVRRYGRWHEHEGVFYSNTGHGPYEDLRGGYSSTMGPPPPAGGVARGGRTGYSPMINTGGQSIRGAIRDDTPANNTKLAVYGTLKAGYSNHSVLRASRFVGHANSKNKLRMFGTGVPFVKEGPAEDGHHITLEIYEVPDEATWAGLDCLEGHPDFYYRKETTVIMEEDGREETVLIYYAGHQPHPNETFYKTFTRGTPLNLNNTRP